MNTKIIFFFFSMILVASSLLVIILKNSVYSAVCLVLSFISSSGILILLECEFFSFLFLIIYVGAIAVLFLFVVMMLDVKSLSNSIDSKYYIFGIYTIFFFSIFVALILLNYFKESYYAFNAISYNTFIDWYNEDLLTEIEALGQVLYTHYTLQFLVAGLILFLAVIGVATLTVNLSEKSSFASVRQVSRVMEL